MRPQMYFSIDVETDGPIPVVNSMLNLGCAAFSEDGRLVDTFNENLVELPGAVMDPKTAEFWAREPKAWEAIRKNPIDPAVVMDAYVSWVEKTANAYQSQPVCVAFPAGFDFTWVYWYMMRFAKRSPFSFACLDMKTLAMEKLGIRFRDCKKSNFPGTWFGPDPHTHIAVDDAIEQGRMFFRILKHGK